MYEEKKDSSYRQAGDVLGLCTDEWGFGSYGDGTVGERYG